jgi:2-oxoglutarate ferredoxin oxidoreductase subunit beta
MSATLPVYKKKDFQSDQDVRWCPGCGDYAILSAVQSVLPELGVPKERFVVVSGIGCSSRFPYYMNTYGFHSIHGRAPAIATGIKIARPDLEVWVATGDGDSLSIGGNHTIHMLRRNVGIKVYSPTSEMGKRSKSTPYGSLDRPFNPLSVALGVEATFVARSVDIFQPHLKGVLKKAAAHPGSAFVEVLQNCNIFNDGAWETLTSKKLRDENTISLEHGQPLVFGKDRDKGIRRKGLELEIVTLGGDVTEKDLVVHDERNPNPAYAFLLSRMDSRPDFPTPIGVLRAVEAPRYEQEVADQLKAVTAKKGEGDLAALLRAGDTWEVT